MAAEVGTAAAVVGLVTATINVLGTIRKARDRIKGSAKSLSDVSQQVESLERALGFVGEEEQLHTASVEEQVRGITGIANELRTFLEGLAAQQERGSVAKFVHALKDGEKEDKELEKILGRLGSAKSELTLRITVAQVGLIGNLSDGFQVAYDVLMRTNRQVNEVLGLELDLAKKLERLPLERNENGIIHLNEADLQNLQLTDVGNEGTSIVGNITLGQVRIMTGNIGIENWQKIAGRKTSIMNNKFGKDVRIVTGDMGGTAAETFNENFWA